MSLCFSHKFRFVMQAPLKRAARFFITGPRSGSFLPGAPAAGAARAAAGAAAGSLLFIAQAGPEGEPRKKREGEKQNYGSCIHGITSKNQQQTTQQQRG